MKTSATGCCLDVCISHRRHHKSNNERGALKNLSMNLILIDFVADSALHTTRSSGCRVIYHDWKSLSGRAFDYPPRGALCGKLIGRLTAERKQQIDLRSRISRATFGVEAGTDHFTSPARCVHQRRICIFGDKKCSRSEVDEANLAKAA